MTNAPHLGDQVIVTNADGSITVATVAGVHTSYQFGFSPTPTFWLFLALVVTAVAAIGGFLVYLSKKENKSN